MGTDEASFLLELDNWHIDWTSTSRYSWCDGNYVVGGDQFQQDFGTVASRTYSNLPSHDTIMFSMNVILLDTWSTTDAYQLQFDTSITFNLNSFADSADEFISDVCGYGAGRIGLDFQLLAQFPHSASELNFQITLNLDQGSPPNHYFGFRDISILASNTGITSQNICGFMGLPNEPDNCPCDEGQYYPGCGACDPACGECVGNFKSDCITCAPGYQYNGDYCYQCNDACVDCFGSDQDECTVCIDTWFLLNTTCIQDCDVPLIANNQDCYSPCPPEKFIADSYCMDECNPPLQPYIQYSVPYCITVCNIGDYPDDLAGCSSVCNYPRKLNDEGPYHVCREPCDDGETFYYNDTCLSISCTSPYASQLVNESTVCVLSCATASNYIYWDETCQTDCPSPLIIESVHDYQVCTVPNCGSAPCDTCTRDNDCPANYYCNTTIRGVCLPASATTLAYTTYSLKSAVIKNILNGYVVRVQVAPLLNITGGSNDVLSCSSGPLIVDEDLKITITKVSTGIFTVIVEILKTMQLDKIPLQFNYSPQRLNLNSSLSLTKVVYISPSVQKAAQAVKTGSIVSFFLLLINILGYVMTGGLGALWSFLPENQYSYYLLYMNINYPYHTKVYFESLSNYNLLFTSTSAVDTTNESLIDSYVLKSLPTKFIDEGYSIDFIENIRQVGIMFLSIAGAAGLVLLVVRFVIISKGSFMVQKILFVLRKFLRWNGIVRQILAYSLPIALACFAEFHIYLFGRQQSLAVVLLSVATILLLLFGLNKFFFIIKHIPNGSFERLVYSERYGTLWEDLNLENRRTKYYFLLVAIRGVVLSYLCVFFDLFPFAQISIPILYQCCVVSLFFKGIKMDPVFENKSLNVVSFIDESMLLLSKIIIFIFLCVDKSADDDLIILMGWMIIGPGAISQVLQTLYSFYEQIKNRKEIAMKIKDFVKNVRNRNKKKPRQKVRRLHSREVRTVKAPAVAYITREA